MIRRDSGSFRDPSGFIYYDNGVVKRRINPVYLPCYRHLTESGLYKELVKNGLLAPHKELPGELPPEEGLVIQPLRIPFISYPYEWSFGMLRDAALLTLRIHCRAMASGMILKDASAYNIQFLGCQAVFIDTLSFDFYREGEPWAAYGQFCRHFLAPLLLMSHVDIRLNQLLRIYLDGIPLDLADRLLRGRGGFAALLHIHFHAKSIAKHGTDNRKTSLSERHITISPARHLMLIENLIHAVEKLRLRKVVTEWGDYYADTNYSDEAAEDKRRIVDGMLEKIKAQRVWDLGANDGRYTSLALAHGAELAAAFDIDPVAVERNYNRGKKTGENLLPLALDLNNPSPGLGFANRERGTLTDRGLPDCVLMLALIHHLAISNNLPLPAIAAWVASLTPRLIIEFVPKEDSRVRRLLACRQDIFPHYTREDFEMEFSRFFRIVERREVRSSQRTIYLLERIAPQ